MKARINTRKKPYAIGVSLSDSDETEQTSAASDKVKNNGINGHY